MKNAETRAFPTNAEIDHYIAEAHRLRGEVFANFIWGLFSRREHIPHGETVK